VVAKNVRGHPVALFGSEGREGFDIAGAEALHLFAIVFGTTKVVP
jgi:alkanesulfonate monooxygenase SsuD/methylene tetrahydromethanopterin reductase-like flavin-dependent oxidoreductase (luciferase family)